MKHHYAESQLFNPQFTFKKEELKKMKKLQIFKSLALQDQIPNLAEVIDQYDRKIPITSLHLNFHSKQQYFSFDDPKEKEEMIKLYKMRA